MPITRTLELAHTKIFLLGSFNSVGAQLGGDVSTSLRLMIIEFWLMYSRLQRKNYLEHHHVGSSTNRMDSVNMCGGKNIETPCGSGLQDH